MGTSLWEGRAKDIKARLREAYEEDYVSYHIIVQLYDFPHKFCIQRED